MSGFRGNDLKAIRVADARGNIDGTSAIVWTLDRDTPYVPSPVLVDGILYFLKTNSGILSALTRRPERRTIRISDSTDVPNVFASPVGAAGRVYFPGREGTTIVISPGRRSRCWRGTRSTMASTPRRRSWTMDLSARYKYLYAIAQQ